MAKPKAAPVKPAKSGLKGKVLKKKVLKTATSTPKLKKLTKAQIQESMKPPIFKKSPSISSESAVESDSDSEPAGRFVRAPRSPIDLDQVREGVRALFEYFMKTKSLKTELFDEAQPIFLRIVCIKVPQTPNRQVRFMLKHKLLSDLSDVCLIVKDIGRPKEHEDTIEFFEKLLQEHGVDNIKTIMPYHQFKTEYGSAFELKRRLVNLYDYFLVDSRISAYVAHLLGKVFLIKRKMPTPVRMNVPHLKEHIDICLRKSLMKVHSKGDCYSVQVGHSKMTPEEVFENIEAVAHQLSDVFPGGIDNIRSLSVKTNISVDVPLYLTLKNKTTLNVPIQSAKRPKHYQDVTGELTTYLDRDVTVLPSGKVIVMDKRTKENHSGEISCNDEIKVKTTEETQEFSLFNDEIKAETTEDTKEFSSFTLQSDTEEKYKCESTTETEENKYESKPAQKGFKKEKAERPQKKELEEQQIKDESDNVLDNAEEAYLNLYMQELQELEKSDKPTKQRKNKLEQKQSDATQKLAQPNKRKAKGKPVTEEIPLKKSKIVIEKTQKKGKSNKVKTTTDDASEATKLNGKIIQSKADKKATLKAQTKTKQLSTGNRNSNKK